jgi:deazaflavin-dependent oxidoreductase (nitroreductase family)
LGRALHWQLLLYVAVCTTRRSGEGPGLQEQAGAGARVGYERPQSGRRRSVVLPYFTIDGKTFVVGSKGGASDDPDWVWNLRKTPAALAYVKRRPRLITTRFADAAERARLWSQLVALAPTYAGYQQGTSREIPLVIIE